MTYRHGPDPREVAREVYAEALTAVTASEMAYHNAVAQHAIASFDVERARTLLGHLVEMERQHHGAVPGEDLTRAQKEVDAAIERRERAKTEVETRFDQKGEAANRLRDARAEVDRSS